MDANEKDPSWKSDFQIFQVFQRNPPSQIEGLNIKVQHVEKELGCADRDEQMRSADDLGFPTK